MIIIALPSPFSKKDAPMLLGLWNTSVCVVLFYAAMVGIAHLVRLFVVFTGIDPDYGLALLVFLVFLLVAYCIDILELNTEKPKNKE